MNIAFLFNSEHSSLGNWYGNTIVEAVLHAGVLQHAERQMRLYVGDVAFSEETPELESTIYTPNSWDRRIKERLEPTYGKFIIYSWLFENMTADLGESLHSALLEFPAYLGAIDLDYASPQHFACFKFIFPEKCRFQGNRCNLLYSMSSEDGQDHDSRETFMQYGFQTEFEDTGLRMTIFNKFPSLDYYRRISAFQTIFERIEGWSSDESSNLVFNLEELHPYLFNILFAAARAFDRAEVVEEISQAWLSGRRFIEQLANYLYPPSNESYIGNDGKKRSVGKQHYKNRLIAYFEMTLNNAKRFTSGELDKFGTELEIIYDLFHRGVHKPFNNDQAFLEERNKFEKAISRLGKWLSRIIETDPASIRRIYGPYHDEMKRVFSRESG